LRSLMKSYAAVLAHELSAAPPQQLAELVR
jgi:hypothetical protein